VRELIGACIQFPIGDPVLFEGYGNLIRRDLGLSFE